MAERLRDSKGRFVKATKPPPLDPELVKGLCAGPRIPEHIWTGKGYEFVFERIPYREHDEREE